eukprot:1160335-Pelagomonas_calceolata.AAC.10
MGFVAWPETCENMVSFHMGLLRNAAPLAWLLMIWLLLFSGGSKEDSMRLTSPHSRKRQVTTSYVIHKGFMTPRYTRSVGSRMAFFMP